MKSWSDELDKHVLLTIFHTMPMRTAGGQNEAGDLKAVRVVISN